LDEVDFTYQERFRVIYKKDNIEREDLEGDEVEKLQKFLFLIF